MARQQHMRRQTKTKAPMRMRMLTHQTCTSMHTGAPMHTRYAHTHPHLICSLFVLIRSQPQQGTQHREALGGHHAAAIPLPMLAYQSSRDFVDASAPRPLACAKSTSRFSRLRPLSAIDHGPSPLFGAIIKNLKRAKSKTTSMRMVLGSRDKPLRHPSRLGRTDLPQMGCVS